ncbi:MAG: TonB family protein [Bacteroidota bacterium]
MMEFIKQHKKGILGTIAFHGILAILILSFGFSTPLPLPEEKGIMINFGSTQDAAGATELEKSEERAEAQEQQQESMPEPVEQEQQETEGVETQEHEEAPAVEEKKEKQKQEEQPEPQEKSQDKKQEEKKEETEPEREVDENALYPGKSNEESGESEGETEGEGNQGKESGTPYSDNHADTDSKGMGNMDYSLSGRNPESLPKPEYNYQVEGKVVVEITVDKYGNVTKAVSGVKGSTTLNDNLLKAAKKAALNAQFDRDPDAPAYQKGTITYYFRLQ